MAAEPWRKGIVIKIEQHRIVVGNGEAVSTTENGPLRTGICFKII